MVMDLVFEGGLLHPQLHEIAFSGKFQQIGIIYEPFTDYIQYTRQVLSFCYFVQNCLIHIFRTFLGKKTLYCDKTILGLLNHKFYFRKHFTKSECPPLNSLGLYFFLIQSPKHLA